MWRTRAPKGEYLTKKTLKSRTIIQFWSKDLIFKPTSIAKTLKHNHSLKEVSSRTCNNVQNIEKKILITIQYYYKQLLFIIIILFWYYQISCNCLLVKGILEQHRSRDLKLSFCQIIMLGKKQIKFNILVFKNHNQPTCKK